MARGIITALDIGTSTVTTVIAKKQKDESLQILGIGVSPSFGVRRGVVVDLEDVTSAIRRSLQEASRAAGVSPKSVNLAVGGSHLSVLSSRGVVAVSRADGEISDEDVRRAIAAAETFIPKNPNKEILHIIPKDFKVDNESGIKDPIGMNGVRLEVDTLVVECSSHFLKNIFKCVESAGVGISDYVFSAIAAAEAVLSKRQKELGVMLLDIGGGTANFVVYEEGVPMHAGVLPFGGNHITNDIAIGFRTAVDIAEEIKLKHGSCLPLELAKKEIVRLSDFIPGEEANYSRKELAEIIEARLCDIFELVQKELKKIDRVALLPAGVVLIGGSARIPGIVDLIKRELKLPAEVGIPREFSESIDESASTILASPLGVISWADKNGSGRSDDFIARSRAASSLKKWFQSFLP